MEAVALPVELLPQRDHSSGFGDRLKVARRDLGSDSAHCCRFDTSNASASHRSRPVGPSPCCGRASGTSSSVMGFGGFHGYRLDGALYVSVVGRIREQTWGGSLYSQGTRWRRAAVRGLAVLLLALGAVMASAGTSAGDPMSTTPEAGGSADALASSFPAGVRCASAGATRLVHRKNVRCSRARVVHSAWYTRRAYRKRWKTIRKKGWRCSGPGQSRGRCWNKRKPKSFRYRPR